MNKIIVPIILIGIFLGSVFMLGWTSNNLYKATKNERTINGLYIYNQDNMSEASKVAKKWDNKGDWVCINVAYDMSPKLAYTTCVHECSHKAFSEIYAESCEKEPLKCLEDLNE